MSFARRSGVRALSGALVRSGAVSWLERRRRGRGDHRAFILEYHQVSGDGAEPEGTVSAERLRRHLLFLKQWFHVVPLQEAVERLRAGRPLGEDLAVVTFDDGFAGNYEHAWPVLREMKVPATIFVTTGFIDGEELWFDRARRSLASVENAGCDVPADLERDLRGCLGAWPQLSIDATMERLKRTSPTTRAEIVDRLAAAAQDAEPPARPLTWDQVRELAASPSIEIGAHTVTHPLLGQLRTVDQRREIEESRRRLEEETGIAPQSFAYPNGAAGDFDDETIALVRDAGFESACSTIRGSNRPGCNPYALARLGVGADSEDVLAARVGGLFDEDVRKRLLGGTS